MNSFPIYKDNGEIKNIENITRWLETKLSLLGNGNYTLSIKKAIKGRTIIQNNLMWMWFECIAQETGNTKEDIHDYYCSKFLKRYIEINGEIVETVGGTSNLDTVAMTNFLNLVQADAASEFGISLPTPDDYRFEQFSDIYKRYI